MTVPPTLIAANRSQLSVLIATNFFGQNTSAIAALEAQYAEMWAQDASAMGGYATSSAAATQLTPFASPAQTTSSEGTAAQSTAVTQATSTPAADAASTISQLLSTLQSFFPDNLTILDGTSLVYASVTSVSDIDNVATGVIGAESNLGVLPSLGAAAAEVPAALAPALSSQVGGAGLTGLPGTISATLTGANSIGPMSVPASWSAPSTSLVSALKPAGLTTLPGTDVPEPNAGAPGVPGMPMGAMQRASGVLPRYGTRLTVMTRPLAGG
jgi:PPE-repeat protein